MSDVSGWSIVDGLHLPDANPGGWPWAVWTTVLWGLGMSFMGGRLLAASLCLRWLAHRAAADPDESHQALIDRFARQLGVSRRVQVVRSGSAVMPMTWGVLRPVILLPAGAGDWTEERMRSVLLHEMAHIRRWDCLTQSLAQIVCAVHWFNPLVWAVARQLRIEREKACDDCVLRMGAQPSRYALHLLEAARSFRPLRLLPVGAVSMARPSQLERRVRAILDPALRRRAVGKRTAAWTLALALITVAPLAAFSPWSSDPSPEAPFGILPIVHAEVPRAATVASAAASVVPPASDTTDCGERRNTVDRRGDVGAHPGGEMLPKRGRPARERPVADRDRKEARPDRRFARDVERGARGWGGLALAEALEAKGSESIAETFEDGEGYIAAFDDDFAEIVDEILAEALDDAFEEAYEGLEDAYEDAFEDLEASLEAAFDREGWIVDGAGREEADLRADIHRLAERISDVGAGFDGVFIKELLRIIKSDPGSREARESLRILKRMEDPRARKALEALYQ